MELEFTTELKTFLVEAIGLWEEAKSLMEESRKQKRGLRPHDCRPLFDHVLKSVAWDIQLFSEQCVQLVDSFHQEGNTNKTPVPASTFQTLKDDVSRLLQSYLLPGFLASDSFITFLQKGPGQCLFTGISKRTGAGKKGSDVSAQGVRRTNQDSDEFMDTAFLHGGHQRIKAASIYPRLLAK